MYNTKRILLFSHGITKTNNSSNFVLHSLMWTLRKSGSQWPSGAGNSTWLASFYSIRRKKGSPSGLHARARRMERGVDSSNEYRSAEGGVWGEIFNTSKKKQEKLNLQLTDQLPGKDVRAERFGSCATLSSSRVSLPHSWSIYDVPERELKDFFFELLVSWVDSTCCCV